MPATADRDSIIQRAAATAVKSMKEDSDPDDSSEQAMKVAQCAISSLKVIFKSIYILLCRYEQKQMLIFLVETLTAFI